MNFLLTVAFKGEQNIDVHLVAILETLKGSFINGTIPKILTQIKMVLYMAGQASIMLVDF